MKHNLNLEVEPEQIIEAFVEMIRAEAVDSIRLEPAGRVTEGTAQRTVNMVMDHLFEAVWEVLNISQPEIADRVCEWMRENEYAC